MLPFICPGCGRMLDANDRLASGTALCSQCEEALRAAGAPSPAKRPSLAAKIPGGGTVNADAANTGLLPAPPDPNWRVGEGAIAAFPPLSDEATTAAQRTPADGVPCPMPNEAPGYEVLGELGRGGMGVVYKARQVRLNRLVALKVIRAGCYAGLHERERFRTEAEAVARLQHPNIVGIYEVGESEAGPFLALEFCSGGPLSRRLRSGPMPPREAAALVAVLADAVHHAHQHGVIHRDLKPANVLLTADGTPKVADFGVARMLDTYLSPEAEQRMGPTASGGILGTPAYMAPEQARGRPREIGPLADVYGLGAVLYECLTSQPPFRAETMLDTLHRVQNEEPAAPRQLRPEVPHDLETVCLKCLEKEPDRRYPGARELADDLRRAAAGEPVRARKVGPLSRLARWCRRPERVGNAGAVGLGITGLFTLWCLFGLAGMCAGVIRPDVPGRFVAYVSSLLAGVYGPLLGIAWKTLARKTWAVWTGAGATLAFVAWMVVMIGLDQAGVFSFHDLTGLRMEQDGRLIADVLIALLLGVQFAAYLVGVVACRANRDVLR